MTYVKTLGHEYYQYYEKIHAWVKSNFKTDPWVYTLKDGFDCCYSITFGHQTYKFRKEADYNTFCEYIDSISK